MTKYFISWQLPSNMGMQCGNLFYTIRNRLDEETIKDIQMFIFNNILSKSVKQFDSFEGVQFLSITKLDS
jgi:hypothetical protein